MSSKTMVVLKNRRSNYPNRTVYVQISGVLLLHFPSSMRGIRAKCCREGGGLLVAESDIIISPVIITVELVLKDLSREGWKMVS